MRRLRGAAKSERVLGCGSLETPFPVTGEPMLRVTAGMKPQRVEMAAKGFFIGRHPWREALLTEGRSAKHPVRLAHEPLGVALGALNGFHASCCDGFRTRSADESQGEPFDLAPWTDLPRFRAARGGRATQRRRLKGSSLEPIGAEAALSSLEGQRLRYEDRAWLLPIERWSTRARLSCLLR